ncbi:MAG: hypothetical protein FK733_03770 [Asgard group archaeon]|nr:hypothetical protein [Asgard group archaeon]
MSKRKVKVEMSDDQDNKVTITFEGTLNEKNLKNLISSANNILGKNSTQTIEDAPDITLEDALELSLKDRVRVLIGTAFGSGTIFTTNELCETYHDVFNVTLKITTASTYLTRFYEEGFLVRSGSRNERKFQVARKLRDKLPKLITQ